MIAVVRSIRLVFSHFYSIFKRVLSDMSVEVPIPPASPACSSVVDLASKTATATKSSGMSTIATVLLFTALGLIVTYVAFEVYKLRLQTKCLLQSHNMEVLEQIVSELPRDIKDSVQKQIKNTTCHTLRVVEDKLASHREEVESCMREYSHDRNPKGCNQTIDSVAVDPTMLIDALMVHANHPPSGSQVIIEEEEDSPKPRLKSTVVVPPTYTKSNNAEEESETPPNSADNLMEDESADELTPDDERSENDDERSENDDIEEEE